MKSQIYCATEQFLFHHITTSLSISFSHLFFEFSGLSTSCSRMFSLFVSALHYSVIHSVMEFDSKKKHFLHTHTHTYTNPPHWFNGFTEFHSLKNFNCVAHGVCASVVCACAVILLPSYSFHTEKKRITHRLPGSLFRMQYTEARLLVLLHFCKIRIDTRLVFTHRFGKFCKWITFYFFSINPSILYATVEDYMYTVHLCAVFFSLCGGIEVWRTSCFHFYLCISENLELYEWHAASCGVKQRKAKGSF